MTDTTRVLIGLSMCCGNPGCFTGNVSYDVTRDLLVCTKCGSIRGTPLDKVKSELLMKMIQEYGKIKANMEESIDELEKLQEEAQGFINHISDLTSQMQVLYERYKQMDR